MGVTADASRSVKDFKDCKQRKEAASNRESHSLGEPPKSGLPLKRKSLARTDLNECATASSLASSAVEDGATTFTWKSMGTTVVYI